MIRTLRDRQLDTDPDGLRAFLEERVVEQVQFAWRTTPAVRQMMEQAGITPADITSLEDFEEKFPILTKKQMRALGDQAFLPSAYTEGDQSGLEPWQRAGYISRFTGGTSIDSLRDFTQITFARSDWHGVQSATMRLLEEPEHPELTLGRRAFVNYTWDHVAAPFFTWTLNNLADKQYTPRPPNMSNRDAFGLMQLKDCDMIITPPTAYRGKGFGLDQLMLHDNGEQPFFTGDNIKFILTSSTPLTPRLYNALVEKGIGYIKDVGGSTDTGPTTINCPDDPHSFHVMQGHVYMEVLDRATKRHVEDGEKGLVVLSRVAGEVHADPFVERLYNSVAAVNDALRSGREPLVEHVASLKQVYGGNVLGRNLDRLEEQIENLYAESARVVPNQGTQLLRFSGTMNETTYHEPDLCGCGRETAKMVGLGRTYDFDGSPEDLKVTKPKTSVKGDTTLAYQIGDSCAVSTE